MKAILSALLLFCLVQSGLSQQIYTLGTRTFTDKEFNALYGYFCQNYYVENGVAVLKNTGACKELKGEVTEVIDDRTCLVRVASNRVVRLSVGSTEEVFDGASISVPVIRQGVSVFTNASGAKQRLLSFRLAAAGEGTPTREAFARVLAAGWKWPDDLNYKTSAQATAEDPAKPGSTETCSEEWRANAIPVPELKNTPR